MNEIIVWPATSGPENGPKIFVSYQNKSKHLLDTLRSLLTSYSVVAMNHDTIPAGEEWGARITKEIEGAFAAICLLTREFFASDYITKVEIPQMLRRHQKEHGKGFELLPLFVTDCNDLFKESALAKIQAINEPKKPYQDITANRSTIEKDLVAAVDRAFREWTQAPQLTGALPPNWGIDPPTDTFMGRAQEREDLKNLIRNGGFVVVNGAPRSGRRTLVRQVAYDLRQADELPGSGVWVDCAFINDYEALVLKVAAVVLRGREQTEAADCDRILRDQFRRQRMLVVLDVTQNPDLQEIIVDWARKITDKSKSKSCVVYVSCNHLSVQQAVWLPPNLDHTSAAELFRKRASLAVGTTEYSDPRSRDLIGMICTQLQFHPFLIELYAKMCGDGVLLTDILEEAERNRHKNTEIVYGELLKPRFGRLEEKYQRPFLLLCQLQGPICREAIKHVTGIGSAVLGKAVRQQFLWAPGESDRYRIESYIREFATHQLDGDLEVTEAEKSAAAGFARAAKEQAALIDKGRLDNHWIAEAALDWFELEWPNVRWCYDTARRHGDTETLYRLADSLVLFMLNRGHLEDCHGIYTYVAAQRRGDRLGYARTLNDMAVCLQYKRDFSSAAKTIKECIKIRTEELNASSGAPDVAERMFRLAQSWNTCGAIEEGDAWSGPGRQEGAGDLPASGSCQGL